MPEQEIGLLRLAAALLRRWRLMVGLPLLLAALTGAASLIVRPTYTAATSFVPEPGAQRQLSAGLAGLAGQLGIPLGAEASKSPRFYADLAKSRELLERILLSRYPNPQGNRQAGDSATLLELMKVRGRNQADILEKGVRQLDRRVSVGVDMQTNIVRLRVEARHPDLAAAVANRFLEYLNEFNAKTRQSQARERRKFVEQRSTEAEADLRQAEDALKSFHERNRLWEQAPELTFEEGRLRRQVDIQQEVYLTLRREYETARVEEVNDTPVITVIDPAVPPNKKSKPKRLLLTGLAFLVGGVVSTLWALSAESMKRARQQESQDYQTFRGALQQTRREIRQAFHSLLRRPNRG